MKKLHLFFLWCSLLILILGWFIWPYLRHSLHQFDQSDLPVLKHGSTIRGHSFIQIGKNFFALQIEKINKRQLASSTSSAFELCFDLINTDESNEFPNFKISFKNFQNQILRTVLVTPEQYAHAHKLLNEQSICIPLTQSVNEVALSISATYEGL